MARKQRVSRGVSVPRVLAGRLLQLKCLSGPHTAFIRQSYLWTVLVRHCLGGRSNTASNAWT